MIQWLNKQLNDKPGLGGLPIATSKYTAATSLTKPPMGSTVAPGGFKPSFSSID